MSPRHSVEQSNALWRHDLIKGGLHELRAYLLPKASITERSGSIAHCSVERLVDLGSNGRLEGVAHARKIDLAL